MNKRLNRARLDGQSRGWFVGQCFADESAYYGADLSEGEEEPKEMDLSWLASDVETLALLDHKYIKDRHTGWFQLAVLLGFIHE